MLEIVKLFFDICLFRKGPQDVPYSSALTGLLIFIYLIVDFLLLNMSNIARIAALEALTETVLTLVFTVLTLLIAKKKSRFQQTFSALLGVDTLISIFSLPALATIIVPQAISSISVLAFFIIVGLMIWHWAVTGHIFRDALDETLGFGLGLALLYLMVSYQILGYFFPTASSVAS